MNAFSQTDLRDEAKFRSCPVDHESVLPAYLLQTKAHDWWWLLHARQMAHRLSSRAHCESQPVGDVPAGWQYTQFPGDGVEVVTLSDRLIIDQQVGSANRLVCFAG